MKRIILISGFADLFNVLLYLDTHPDRDVDQNSLYLCDSGNVPPPLLQTLSKLAQQVPSISSFARLDTKPDKADNAIETITSEANDQTKELITWRAFGQFEVEILKRIDAERYTLVENGIATYSPPRSVSNYSDTKVLSKIERAWLPLSPAFGKPAYLGKTEILIPEPDAYRKLAQIHMTKAAEKSTLQEVSSTANFVVGTSLFRTGAISEEEESACYRSFIEECLSKKKRIIWKPHPRCHQSPLWTMPCGIEILTSSLPVEWSLSQFPPGSCELSSIASTALATGELYFSTLSSTIEGSFSERLESKLPHTHLIRKRYRCQTKAGSSRIPNPHNHGE